MYYDDDYFVLITKKYFGVFDFKATSYPPEFRENMECVCAKKRTEIDEYLLKHPDVGRNLLNKCGFRMPVSVGRIYYH